MKLMPILKELPDHRRKQGKQYDLAHILLFTLLAMLCGANSYRKVATFIKVRFCVLKQLCGISWKKAPGYTTIRKIYLGIKEEELEALFRSHAGKMATLPEGEVISIDGKSLRGSFDHEQDQVSMMMVSAFASADQIILGHIMLNEKEKESEIPAVQLLIKELNLSGKLFSMDALHCQKNAGSCV